MKVLKIDRWWLEQNLPKEAVRHIGSTYVFQDYLQIWLGFLIKQTQEDPITNSIILFGQNKKPASIKSLRKNFEEENSYLFFYKEKE